jgi:hypothetical protein
MGGSGMRTQANYDGWWNGGMRNTCTYHNTIALLTEIIGSPTPIEIPLIPEKQLYTSDLPLPIAPQPWHFHKTIEYLMETNRAMADYGSRHRDELLYNIWRMGMNSIERGSKDYWTVTPKRVEALRAAAGEGPEGDGGRGGRGARPAVGGGDVTGGGAPSGPSGRGVPAALYEKVLHDPQMRDPRSYIMPSDQPDFPTATRFVNALLKNGLTVMQATAAFRAAGKNYPAGSYVVKTAQAFRPMVRDMFEPQDHPRDDLYPGGPPVPPYDIAGWTLAMQMGVQYDRVLDGFDGPFVKLTGLQKPMPREVTGMPNPAGYLISHRSNYSFTLINRLLQAGAEVYWLKSAAREGGEDLGTGAIWVPSSTAALPVLRKGANDLGIAVHAVAKTPGGEFVESGGTVVTVGGSTRVAELLGLPVTNTLAGLPREQFYIPGSLMRARVDNTNPLAYGMPETVDVFFDNNPVFRLPEDAPAKGQNPVAWFAGKDTLDSGWALGQQLLDGAAAVVEARAGEGKVFVLGPEVTFRGEPDGTYKLLFNGLFYGAAKSVTLP